MKSRTSPLDRVLGRLDDLDEVNLGILVQRLAKDRRLLETIFDVIRDGILVLDGAGSIQYANLQGRRLIGLKESSVGKVKVARAAPEIARALGFDHKDGFPQAAVVTRELSISYPDFRYVRLYAVPIDEEDGDKDSQGNRSLAVVLSDVTEDKVSTEELIESEKVASIMNLAAGVAHELGNPLNSINIHLQLMLRRLKESGEDDKLGKSLETCIKEVERLDGIIAHFLEAIRPSEPDFRETNLLDLLEETLRGREEELKARKVSAQVEAGAKDPVVFADPGQLKQVFFNVIGNAIAAMDKNPKLRVITSGDDENVYVQFVDSGVGIAREDVPKVFEPYYTTKKGGHGIGMMIVYRIMRDHGGDVGIDSKPGAGTIVTLRLPRKDRRMRLLEEAKT
ncbi:MAG: ATP-binding protein [Opitutales bacterium]